MISGRFSQPADRPPVCVYPIVWWQWRKRFEAGQDRSARLPAPVLDRLGLAKAAFATVLLLALFATGLAQVTGVLLVAGYLLISRRLATRTMLGLVDWHLLVMFCGLFVVTHALATTGLPDRAVFGLEGMGLHPERLLIMAPLTLIGANTIGNVPLVVLLLSSLHHLGEGTFYALAVLSTLAGNLSVIGSLANIIALERAREAGVRLSFPEHARCGVPMTLASCLLAFGWLWLLRHALP